MKMQQSHLNSMKKHAIMPTLVIVSMICSTAVAFSVTEAAAYDYTPSLGDYEEWYSNSVLHFFGAGAKNELNISVESFLNGTFPRSENIPFHVINKLGTTSDYLISGVPLWSIFEHHDLLQLNATCVKFIGNDGYKTYNLPIRIFENDSEQVFIVTQEDGQPPEDGPLKVAVMMDAIQNDIEIKAMFEALGQPGENSVHNSKYSMKWLAAIEINYDVLNYTTASTTPSTSTPTDENTIPGFDTFFLLLLGGIGIIQGINYSKKTTVKSREEK